VDLARTRPACRPGSVVCQRSTERRVAKRP